MRCNICYLPIHEERSRLACPMCTNTYHRDHLAAWLLKEKACPVCRNELSEAFREDLRPKTEKERRRLDQILYTLDNVGDLLDNWETGKRQKKRVKEMRKLDGIDYNTRLSLGTILKLAIPVVFIGISLIAFLALLTSA